MVATHHYRFALLNSTSQDSAYWGVDIPRSKWHDSKDLGGNRNIANFRAKCSRERKASPLSEVVSIDAAGSPERRVESAVVVVRRSTRVGGKKAGGKRSKSRKREKGRDGRKEIESFWDRAFKLY